MTEVKSGVLAIEIEPSLTAELEVDTSPSFTAAAEQLVRHNYPVLLVGLRKGKVGEVEAFLGRLPHSPAIIIVHEKVEPAQLTQLLVHQSVFGMCSTHDYKTTSELVHKAVIHAQQKDQDSQLLQLFEAQNERLRKLSQDLESRVEKREQSLKKAHEKLMLQSSRLEGLLRALMALQKARSIREMEQLLKTALNFILNVTTVRIHHRANIQALPQNELIYSADLTLDGRTLGHITFVRDEIPFLRDEKVFLDQVSETIALAMDRLAKLELVENLKAQWEATFDAITHPLALVDESYSVIRSNEGYKKLATDPSSAPCFTRAFGRDSVCTGCRLGESFELNHGSKIYSVFSQKLLPSGHYLVLYRDITEERALERQIFESAKLAEMGTIGSSIAHELNNPLGGMISFLQLIKSDLIGNEPHFEDIAEMEKGAQRCKEIIQNLLGFSRKQEASDPEPFDLRDAITQALKITDLQTRSRGIRVEALWGSEPAVVSGHLKLFSQALCHLLQNAAEAVQLKYGRAQLSQGHITVQLKRQPSEFEIWITDNGASPQGVPQMGVPLAQQLIKIHGGRLEIPTENPTGRASIKVVVPRSA
jgi:two-component system NtrC family sensor kinase